MNPRVPIRCRLIWLYNYFLKLVELCPLPQTQTPPLARCPDTSQLLPRHRPDGHLLASGLPPCSSREVASYNSNGKKDELKSFLEVVPSVDFCCVYGSTLHPNNHDKSAMVDFILGVSDPLRWHFEECEIEWRSLCFMDGASCRGKTVAQIWGCWCA